jgi:prevent-host-death family protein
MRQVDSTTAKNTFGAVVDATMASGEPIEITRGRGGNPRPVAVLLSTSLYQAQQEERADLERAVTELRHQVVRLANVITDDYDTDFWPRTTVDQVRELVDELVIKSVHQVVDQTIHKRMTTGSAAETRPHARPRGTSQLPEES